MFEAILNTCSRVLSYLKCKNARVAYSHFKHDKTLLYTSVLNSTYIFTRKFPCTILFNYYSIGQSTPSFQRLFAGRKKRESPRKEPLEPEYSIECRDPNKILIFTHVKRVSQRSGESRGFSPGAPVSSHRES